jgi:hypothetical protein
VRRQRGRNRTKADLVVYRTPAGPLAVKDYSSRPWLVRQTLGRLLIRRETRAYEHLSGLPGLPAFHGRLGPYSLALQWIDGRPLSEHEDGSLPPAVFDELQRIVAALHARGVALADLNHRDVLLGADGRVHVLDLAMACRAGRGAIRRQLFERFAASDRFALARLRARFTGEDAGAVIAAADPRVLAWHRRGRRLKWYWDKLRGAERVPPGNDHWRPR